MKEQRRERANKDKDKDKESRGGLFFFYWKVGNIKIYMEKLKQRVPKSFEVSGAKHHREVF